MPKQKSAAAHLPQKWGPQTLLHALWPSRCVGCASYAPIAPATLCAACRSAALGNGGARCDICDGPWAWAAASCGRSRRCAGCWLRPPAFVRLRTPWLCVGPLRLWLLDARRSEPRAAGELSMWLWCDAAVRALVRDSELVPVPGPAAERAGAGGNTTSELARALGRRAQRPMRRLLARAEDAAPLRPGSAPRPRFDVSAQPQALAGRTLTLVSDIVTEARTLRGAAAALVAAGAPRPRAVAIARVPP